MKPTGASPMNTAVPLPQVTPSSLPLTGGTQGQDRMQLAQTLNLFGR